MVVAAALADAEGDTVGPDGEGAGVEAAGLEAAGVDPPWV